MIAAMRTTTHLSLFTVALLLGGCSKAEPAQAANTPTPPAAATPPAADAPATPAPKVSNHVPQAPTDATQPAAPAAAPTLADLPGLLAGIKDGATATAAKGKLDALVTMLEQKKLATEAKDAKAPAATGLDLGKLAGSAMEKLGVSAETTKQITDLLAKPEVKAAIGTSLEKLKGLLP
jgi:hypothetical protein